MSERMDELVIVDGYGDVVMRASEGSSTATLVTYVIANMFPAFTALDIGGVRALADWLTAWLERREAGEGEG